MLPDTLKIYTPNEPIPKNIPTKTTVLVQKGVLDKGTFYGNVLQEHMKHYMDDDMPKDDKLRKVRQTLRVASLGGRGVRGRGGVKAVRKRKQDEPGRSTEYFVLL